MKIKTSLKNVVKEIIIIEILIKKRRKRNN